MTPKSFGDAGFVSILFVIALFILVAISVYKKIGNLMALYRFLKANGNFEKRFNLFFEISEKFLESKLTQINK